MPIKKVSHTEIVVAQILEQMQGERWEHLRFKLKTKGLRALIAETTLEESKIIQQHISHSFRSRQTQSDSGSLMVRLQNALKKGIEQSTSLTWPALNPETFDA